MDFEKFINAQQKIWEWINEIGPGGVGRVARQIGHAYDRLMMVFRASTAFTSEIASKIPRLKHLPRISLLGLYALMYHDHTLLSELLKADPEWDELTLAESFGFSVEDLRDCLTQSYMALSYHVGIESWRRLLEDKCVTYWKRGTVLSHIGSLLIHNGEKPPNAPPRLICVNALVPWILSVLRDLSTGSLGAGSIAVVGASIGRGKTTTLYYSLRSALYALNPGTVKPTPKQPETMADIRTEVDDIIPYLMLFNPEDFLDAIRALADSGVKAPIIVVDNASILFPKQWIKATGELHKFYLNMNTVIDLLRGVCGATIFVANAPNELASFIRNAATINITGREEPGIKTYSVTIYTWKRPTLRIREEEELVKMRERIASIYVYPLLKLPQEIYKLDLKVKIKTITKKTQEAIKHYKTEKKKKKEK
jgi:hypothetical protein